MGYFQKDNKFKSKRSFKGRSEDRQMYQAVCSQCGHDCQVPFKPFGGKPVLCSHCFEKSNDSRPRQSSFRPQANPQLDAISLKLDKIIELLSTK